MKTYLAIVAAAAITVGGLSVAFADDKAANSNDQNTSSKIEQETAKVGIGTADKASEKMSPHAEQIHDVLAQVAEAAFTKDGFTDIAERFVKADRDRLLDNDAKDALKNDDTANGRIAELQKDWDAKYNGKFDIKDEDKVYNMSFASIDEMGANNARTAGGTVAPDANTGTTAAPTTPVDVNTNANRTDSDRTNDHADKNRDTATVHIVASHGLPAIDVPMVHETMGWRIDIPDSVDSAKLKNNLQTALTDIGEKKDQWSADKDDAYRHATHRLLLAIFDKPAMEAGGATGSAGASGTTESGTTGAAPAVRPSR